MKRLPTLFLLIFSLLTLATPGRAQTITDTIRFTVTPSTEAGAENTLVYMFWEEIAYDIRMEWVSEGEREELAWDYYMQQTITSSGQVYIYFSYEQDEMDGLRVNLRKIPVGAPEPPMFGNSNFLNVFTYSPDISAFDASGCRILDELRCINAQLTELNISGTALTVLDCSGNQLTELNISGTALTELNCSGNQLTELDISGCTALTELNCSDNKLTELNVSSCTALTSLDCSDNQLTVLNVNGCTALTNLDCAINQLTTLDVSGCIALKTFGCNNNQLTALNVDNNTALEYLMCSDNQLTGLDLSHNTDLESLYGYSNQLTSLNVNGCTALTDLACGNNQLTSLDVSSLQALRFLFCENNPLTSLDCAGNNALETLVASDCASLSQLTNISGKQLERVAVNGCTSLMNLDCSNNKILMLNVSGCTALETLECYNNQLTSLDVSGCTALTSLDCWGNQLKELDVSANALTHLFCDRNQLAILNVGSNSVLEVFDCCYNHIPLSTLYGIYSQRENWYHFDVTDQTDTVTLSACQTLDLDTEGVLGEITTTYTLRNTSYQNVPPDAYTEDNFSFRFNDPFKGTLTLRNKSLKNFYEGEIEGTITMTYHITAEACSVEPPTPPTTITDTIRFDVVRESSDAEILCKFSDKVKGGIEIEWVSTSGPSVRFIPDQDGFTADASGYYRQTLPGNGQVRIYYTHAPEAEPYKLVMKDYTFHDNDIYISYSSARIASLNVSGCTALDSLDVSGNQLTSLNVCGCTALTYLKCNYNNQLTDLNVSGCGALINLGCSNNQLTALNVSDCEALKVIGCQRNQLTTLDVSNNTNLEELNCVGNQLTALNVDANTALKELYVSSNQLTSLNVGNNIALEKLYCTRNQLSELNVSNKTSLENLQCMFNQLTSLDVSGCTALTTLYCNNNHIPLSMLHSIYTQRASWNTFSANNQTDTVNLSMCEVLNLATEKMLGGTATTYTLADEDGNSVSSDAYTENDFSFQFNDAFTGTLTLQNDNVPDASMTYHITAEKCLPTDTIGFTIKPDFSILGRGHTMTLRFNLDVGEKIRIERVLGGERKEVLLEEDGSCIQGITSEAQYYIYYSYEESSDGYVVGFYNGLYPGPSRGEKIRAIINGSNIDSFDIDGCSNLTELYCDHNQIAALNVRGCTSLTRLDCSHNSLSELDVRGCTSLAYLNCYANVLTELDVSGFTSLTELNCGSNQLTDLDVSGCAVLTNLNIEGNRSLTTGAYTLKSLNASGCSSLESLDCSRIALMSLDVSGCTSMTELHCEMNQLSALDVSGCTALTGLFCDLNQLTALDVSSCTALTSLNCRDNQLSALDVSGCTSLTELFCDFNQLTSLDVSGFTSLEVLLCDGNQLSELNVNGCTALTFFSFRENNGLTSLKANGCISLERLDVSGCTALTQLWCNHSQRTTLDVRGCVALEELDCSYNQLTELDVHQNPALLKLLCYNNELTGLDVSDCSSLTNLNCNENQLTSLNVRGCTALTNLKCGYNQLTALDVGGCAALTQLRCYNNHIPLSTIYGIYMQRANWGYFDAEDQTDTITLSACEALDLATEKTLGGTATTYTFTPNITSSAYTEDNFSFTFNEAFTGTLTLQNDNVPNASMTYHITAEECSVEPPTPPTTTTDTLYFEFELAEGAASDAIEYAFSDAVLPGITMEYYDGQEHPKFTPNASGSILIHGNGYGRIYYTYEENEGYKVNCTPRYSGSDNNSTGDIRLQRYANVSLTGLDAHACSAMKELTCYHNQLTDLNVRGCLRLEELYCYQNQLTALNVSQSPALTMLSCESNQLTSLDVSQNLALTRLDCNNNQLTSLDVSQNAGLTILVCSNNQLTSLDVRANTAMESLDCDNNQLTVLDVSQNLALTELVCNNNQLTSLDVSQNSDLRRLGCSDNRLTTLDVRNKTALVELNCYNNQLTDLNVSGCVVLEYLYCGNNQLTVLDVSDCSDLGALDCSDNQLNVLNISGCTALMMLDCQNNQLRDLDASGCESLLALSCQNNHIPLSTLYGILEPGTLMLVSAEDQSDTVVIDMEQAWDLSSEKTLGETETTYVLADGNGNRVSEDAYTEDGFVFRLYEPASYTLTLQNQDLTNNLYGNPSDVITFTWHITVREFFKVEVVSNNEAWGWATKTGSGTYEKDSMVTIIATPREGYRFVNWTRTDGEVFSLDAVYSFAVTENISLVAVFEEIPEVPVPPVVDSFSVVVSANNADWGMAFMTGNGRYEKDSAVTIIATPAEGYRFVNWTKGSEIFSIYAVYSFAVTEDIALVANFEKIPEVPEPPVGDEFTITLIPNNPEWGMVFKTGNCVYGEGDEIKILALPYVGYRFVNWTKEDGSVFGTDSLITFKVTESLDLTANFEKIPDGPVVKRDLRVDSIPVGMVAPPLLPNDGLPGFPAEAYPFENEEMTYTAVFHGDSAVLRVCPGNELRLAIATSGGEGALTYTWTADRGGATVYESGAVLAEWPYVTNDSVLVLFFPDTVSQLLNCHITDEAGSALDVRVQVGYNTPELLYIEVNPKTTSAKYYEDQAVYFHARPQRYADYYWFRLNGGEGYAEITDQRVLQEAMYPTSFRMNATGSHQGSVWVSAMDRNGCRLWDSAGVELMRLPNVMVLNDPNRPLDGVIFPEFEVEITNAWGLCVKGFTERNGNGSSLGWDGNTRSGTKVTAGTYYYKVKIPTLEGFVYMNGAVTVVNR